MNNGRFPRTLREAFPSERFCAIEVTPKRSSGDRFVAVICWIAVVAVVAILVFS